MFLVVAKKSRTFCSFHVWLMSRCAKDEGKHSQDASSSWPVEIFHIIGFMFSLEMGVS